MVGFWILISALGLVGALRSLPSLRPTLASLKPVATASAAGAGSALVAPQAAGAVISDSANDALALLDGYQSVAPPSVAWTVLIVGGLWLYFKIFKIMASS